MRQYAFVRLMLILSFATAVIFWYETLHIDWVTVRKMIYKINVNDQYNWNKQQILSNFTEMSKLIGADRLPFTLYRSYSLENPTLCSSVSSLLILVAVKSSPTHFDNRKILRETWMNQIDKLMIGRAKFLFLIGKTNSSIQKGIEDEFSRYGDILQGDFIDTYRNLTEKGVTLMKWINERCRNAKIILQTDDDVVVNVFNLFKYMVPSIINQSKTVICNVRWLAPIRRNEKRKWSVESNLFPNRAVFPPFCTGFFVLYTNDLTPLLYETAKSTPFFWIDDLYLYGLLLNRIPGVDRRKMKHEAYAVGDIERKSCFYANGWRVEKCEYVTVAGNVKVDELRNFWNEIVRNNLQDTNTNMYPLIRMPQVSLESLRWKKYTRGQKTDTVFV